MRREDLGRRRGWPHWRDLVEADHGFAPGAGLLGDTPDATVSNIGRLAAEGMRGTDEVIVDVLRRDDGV